MTRRERRRSSGIEALRGRERLRRRLKWVFYGVCCTFLAVLFGPVVLDRAFGALRAAPASECRVLAVLDADRYRLSCEIVGRQTARLLGADTPASRGVDCAAEFVAGTRAKWAARAALWGASRVEARLDGFGWRDAPLVIVSADGERLSGRLVRDGLARADDGYGTGGWCNGEIAALSAGTEGRGDG
jgi:endonuclease YncB( thermonuclease family)